MASNPKIHWKAPTIMLVAFTGGTLLAIGHHLYYSSLRGQAVSLGVFDQQMNLRIGTGFSLLVRSALVLAIGVSYWQIFWGTFMTKQLSIPAVDSLSGLLSALPDFFNEAALRANPMLFLLGGLSWLIPLATVVPPATLTVSTSLLALHDIQHLPAINFAIDPMVQIEYNGLSACNWPTYDGSSPALTRLALGTAIQGAIPNMPTTGTNSSYNLDFHGPAVRCKRIPVDILHRFDAALGCDLMGSIYNKNYCNSSYQYISWVPESTIITGYSSLVPYGNGSLNATNNPTGLLPIDSVMSYVGSLESDPATIFVAAQTNPYSTVREQENEWMVASCSLWNATYSVGISFPSTGQDVSVSSTQYNHPVSIETFSDLPCDQLRLADLTPYGPNLSYQATMENLGRLLVGTIFRDDDLGYVHQSTNVMQTNLAFTKELLPLYKANTFNSNFTLALLQHAPHVNESLPAVIEQMFQNMTLATFSQNQFLVDKAVPTNVTTLTTHNVYSYSSSRLILSYGLAVGFTFAAVLLGAKAIWDNKASYSNRFSTVLRTTYNADISAYLSVEDRAGADPLPKHLERLKIQGDSATNVPEKAGKLKCDW